MGCEHKKTQTLVGDNDTERVVCCDCGETLAEARVESGESLRGGPLTLQGPEVGANDEVLRKYINEKLIPYIDSEFAKAYDRAKALDKCIDVCFKNDESIREYINHTLLPNVKLKGWFF